MFSFWGDWARFFAWFDETAGGGLVLSSGVIFLNGSIILGRLDLVSGFVTANTSEVEGDDFAKLHGFALGGGLGPTAFALVFDFAAIFGAGALLSLLLTDVLVRELRVVVGFVDASRSDREVALSKAGAK